MKPHPPSSPPLSSSPPAFLRLLPRAVYFLRLFSLGYTLGFFSTTTTTTTGSSSSHSRPQFHVQTQFQSQPDNKILVSTSPPPLHDLLRFRTKCADPVPQPEIVRTVLDRVYNGSSPYAGFPPPAIAPLLYPSARHPRGWGSTNPVFRDLIESVRPPHSHHHRARYLPRSLRPPHGHHLPQPFPPLPHPLPRRLPRLAGLPLPLPPPPPPPPPPAAPLPPPPRPPPPLPPADPPFRWPPPRRPPSHPSDEPPPVAPSPSLGGPLPSPSENPPSPLAAACWRPSSS